MSYSQLTKNALGRSLKKLMLAKPLHKITIQQIVDDCGVTRHTFYNHFRDIYELLGWIYQTEIINDLEQYRNYADWKQGFLKVLRYTRDNKTVCLNTFHSLGREHLERFLYGVIYGMAIGVVDDLAQSMLVIQDAQAKRDVADFYSRAILAQVIQWLQSGANTDPGEIVDRVGKIIDGSVRHSLEKYR
jgi:probable dihydroxyacetone kinase regulator